MAGATVYLEVDDESLLGAHLLATLEGVADDDVEGFAGVLTYTLNRGIVERVRAAGLAWPPTPGAFETAGKIGAQATASDAEQTAAQASRDRRRLAVTVVVGLAVAVVLIGGYGYHWHWTGLTTNNQLWDWLQLLLLPVAFGTFPLWLRYSEYMSPARRRALGVAVLVFAVFVLIGYTTPMRWTGFPPQKLWNWLTLILLPIAIVTVRAWPTTGREIRRLHVLVGAFVILGLVVTVIGGYAGSWTWTGYKGNTLWDWTSILLAPIAVSTVVVPALVRLVSGRAGERATAKQEQAAREKALAVARERAARAATDRS